MITIKVVKIRFDQALAVAVVGLVVNLASALLLREDRDHEHEHRHLHPDHNHAAPTSTCSPTR